MNIEPECRGGALYAKTSISDNETPVLNALKALHGAPIRAWAGEYLPVELLTGSHLLSKQTQKYKVRRML